MKIIIMDEFVIGIILFCIGVFLMCLSSFLLFTLISNIIIVSLTFILGSIIYLFGLWRMIVNKDEEETIQS